MKNILQKTKQSLVINLLSLDAKATKLIPNPKIRKITYIGVGSLFGFMFLIILIGIILSPFRDTSQSGFILNKPKIGTVSTAPQKELNEMQKNILELENEIKNLRFPESSLNIPVLESDIKI